MSRPETQPINTVDDSIIDQILIKYSLDTTGTPEAKRERVLQFCLSRNTFRLNSEGVPLVNTSLFTANQTFLSQEGENDGDSNYRFSEDAQRPNQLLREAKSIKTFENRSPDALESFINECERYARIFAWTDADLLCVAYLKVSSIFHEDLDMNNFTCWEDFKAGLRATIGLTHSVVSKLFDNFARKQGESILSAFKRLVKLLKYPAIDFERCSEPQQARTINSKLLNIMGPAFYSQFELMRIQEGRGYDLSIIKEIIKTIEANYPHLTPEIPHIFGQPTVADVNAIREVKCFLCSGSHKMSDCGKLESFSKLENRMNSFEDRLANQERKLSSIESMMEKNFGKLLQSVNSLRANDQPFDGLFSS